MSIDIPLSVKYRPKKLSDVIGQPVVTRAFANAFKYNNLHHAYILAGNFGTGKTSIARIIAAMENCEEGKVIEPCGVCDNCKAIFNGKSFDVKEFDAASNRGIDDIKSIHKDLHVCPIQCRTKYVIIDEAHSLTGYAAEAALKMIEEPPKNVRFILTTTEPQSLINTIHSRCITWKFNKVGWIEIYNHLIKICKLEKINFEEDALKIIAKMSKGSVRDALQNLQTVINYVGEEIISLDVSREVLGVIDQQLYFDLVHNIINKDGTKCYQIINDILLGGKNAGCIVDELYTHLDILLTVKVCKTDMPNTSLTIEEIKKYSYQTNQVKGEFILKMMDLLDSMAVALKYNLNPQILLDKFVVKSILAQKKYTTEK